MGSVYYWVVFNVKGLLIIDVCSPRLQVSPSCVHGSGLFGVVRGDRFDLAGFQRHQADDQLPGQPRGSSRNRAERPKRPAGCRRLGLHRLVGLTNVCLMFRIQNLYPNPSLSSLSSLGYKPFLSLIQPQLQQLMESTSEQVQPEAFQPASQTSKLSASEGLGGVAAPRVEDSRGVAAPLGMALPSLEPAGGSPRPPSEDSPPEQSEEQTEEEGTYDCTLS